MFLKWSYFILQCLKCHHKFIQPQFLDTSTLSKCPKCRSKMVIKFAETVTIETGSSTEQPEGDNSNSTGDEEEVVGNRSGVTRRTFSRRPLKRRNNRESSPIVGGCSFKFKIYHCPLLLNSRIGIEIVVLDAWLRMSKWVCFFYISCLFSESNPVIVMCLLFLSVLFNH